MANHTITSEAASVLQKLLYVLQDLTLDEYTEKIPLLGNSSIGEHTRHIIELFQGLMTGYDLGTVNYDARKRDMAIQTNIEVAMNHILDLLTALPKADKPLFLVALAPAAVTLSTHYERELLYNIEHCIHHQAIIRIGLGLLQKSTADDDFGVAPSTILYRQQQCVR